MRAIDGTVRVRAPEEHERWPAGARIDLSVTSDKGPSAAVFLTESDVRTLYEQLRCHLDPPAPTAYRPASKETL